MNAQHWIAAYLPQVLPPGWKCSRIAEDGAMYFNVHSEQSLILSGDTEQDGKRWIHLSTAFPTRQPTWDELVQLKEWILGRETKAIQIIPPRTQHVFIHPYIMHLFSCVDEDRLPDFTRGRKTLYTDDRERCMQV
jgi:hypothetical protein